LTLHGNGEPADMRRIPRSTGPGVLEAFRAYRALRERAAPAFDRLGSNSFAELGATLLDLRPKAYARRGELLAGLRLLPLGQPTRAEVEHIAGAQRLDLSGTLENPGHAIVGFYISDPDLAAVEIERVNMEGCRGVARELGIDLTDILAERSARWPKMMRWEAA